MNDHNPPKECSGTGFSLMPSLQLSTLPQARPRSGSTADTILDLHCLHRSLSPSVKVFPMQLVTWLGSQRTAACCSMIVSLKIEVFPYNLIFIGLWGHGRCLAGDWRACHWNGGKRNSSVCSWNGGRGHLWPAGIVVPSGLREYLAWRQPQSRDQTWWEFQRLVSSEPGLWESRGSFFQYFADSLHVRGKNANMWNGFQWVHTWTEGQTTPRRQPLFSQR